MNALWTRLCRVGASMMLVAALAFAFHAGVVAASFHGGSVQASATAAHQHDEDHGSHDHPTGHGDHAHVAEAAEVHADADHSTGHCKTNCCGAACTMAVLAVSAVAMRRADVSAGLISSFVAVLSGIDPGGLKRPPRTPSIA